MKIQKISKYVISIVLCSCLLTACDDSGIGLTSLTDPQQKDVVSPAYSRSVWANMSEQFQLAHETDRPEVKARIAYLQAHKEELYHDLKAEAPLINYAFEQTQKRGLPAELALLPIIESDCNPNERSKPGALGIWQLMPGTAHDLGLKSSHAYDARKDIYASTKAALDFLADLHQEMQNDWLLAFAAYNWGPGNVSKAVSHQKKWYARANFWSLKLPKETQVYIPKVLALAAVIRDPARYNIKLPSTVEAPHLAAVQVKSPAELQQVAENSGVNMADIRHLNPAYRNLATSPGAPNKFIIPIKPVHQPIAAIALNKPAAPSAQELIKTIIKEGPWVVLAMANAPQDG